MTEHATPQEVPIDFGEERGLERIHPKPADDANGVSETADEAQQARNTTESKG